MATPKKPAKKTPAGLPALFNKALPGEAHPDERSIRMMMRAAIAISLIGPWTRLSDSNLYAFDSESGQRWYCAVMGALGQVYGLQVYRGDAGFALFDDVQNDRIADSEAFISRQDLFTVEFVPRAELTPLDRAMLALAPELIPRGQLVPQVTVSRPLYLRWFPNAADVAEINDCLMASLLFYEWLAAHPKTDPWKKKGEFPLVSDWLTSLTVTQIPHPARPPAPLPAPSRLDERRLNQLLIKLPSRPLGAPIELDVFVMLAPIGGTGRPYFPWAALACDAASGFILSPSVGAATEKPEDVLLRCALEALERSPSRPSACHVRDQFAREVLEPIAKTFDIPIRVAKLPGIAEARAALETHMSH